MTKDLCNGKISRKAKAEKQLQSLMINTAIANRLTTKPLENGLMSARPNNDYSLTELW